jgi:hypothetical protein
MLHFASLLLFVCFHVIHPFHVSINEISYNEKESTLEITKKIFSDDLELALKNDGLNFHIKQKIDPELHKAIQNYLQDKFKIFIDDEYQRLNFLGYEVEEDAVWCYLQIDRINSIKEIAVFDITLFETYSDQVNLVHLNYKNSVESFKLDEKTPEKAITFR